MKLVMTLLVRDEADILRANIEFHLAHGVDFIIAMDNLSVDATPDILREYERRGLLHYLRQPEDDYSQHRWVTGMARLAFTQFGADWVINNDADEFWWPETGDLRRILAGLPASRLAAAAERTNFLPRHMEAGAFFADAMTVRERRSLNALGDPLPGKVCHRGLADIEVSQGNHAVARQGRPVPAIPVPVTIMHFPLRNYAQFANRTVQGGAAYARNAELPPGTGAVRRHLYQVWQEGGLEAYFQRAVLDEASVERGLAEGRLVRDERLRLFLKRCFRQSGSGRNP